uniref:protein turtle homolog B-like n=1 Tax=Pristiophorus japonicus TaxID=55135 RepID=UPI00398ED7BA
MTRRCLAPAWVWTSCISLLVTAPALMQRSVSQTPSFLSVKEGETVTLTCTLQIPPTDVQELIFNWTRERTHVICPVEAHTSGSSQCNSSDPRVSARADLSNKSSVLTIARASPKDSGTYWCQVKIANPVPIIQLQGNGCVVLVQAAGPPTEFVSQTPPFLSVTEGESISLTCTLQTTAAIDPEGLNFTWSGASTEVSCPIKANISDSSQCVSPDPRVSATADLPRKFSVLRITRASQKDNGTYRCQVTILKPHPSRTLCGNGSVVLVQAMVPPAPASYQSLAAVSVALIIVPLVSLIYFLVKKHNKGKSPNRAPGLAGGNRQQPESSEQVGVTRGFEPFLQRPRQYGPPVQVTLSPTEPEETIPPPQPEVG